jgi:sugar/nucleoside kinase (ribokinase family)
LISGLGDDAFGRLLRKRLQEAGVNLSGVQVVPDYSTGMAFVGYAASGRRDFVFHLRHSAGSRMNVADLPGDYFAGVSWLHLSGSALALGDAGREACRQATELALKAGGRLSLDPNLRPELMALDEARQALAPYMAEAAVLLPTVDEARTLTGLAADDEAATALLGGKERIVVLKRGAEGCSVYSMQDRLDVPGFVVDEVDPTGAGDCFNAAFLLGLDAGWDLGRVARFANAAGALAVTRQGPMEGAPTVQQINELIDSTLD